MAESILRVAVLGAGRWADLAHILGWNRNPRCHLVALCDVQEDLAQSLATKHQIGEVTTDWRCALPLLSDHHPVVDHYFRRFQKLWEDCRASAEEHQLVTWPDYPLGF